MSEQEQPENLIPADEYERELMTDLDDDTPDKPKGIAASYQDSDWSVVGVIAGLIINWTIGGKDPRVSMIVENFTRPIGQLFLNLLLMIVVPLVFASLLLALPESATYVNLGELARNRLDIRL